MYIDIVLHDKPPTIRCHADSDRQAYVYLNIDGNRIGVHGTLDQLAAIGEAIVREAAAARMERGLLQGEKS
jgi:hypothetical protein